MPQYRVTSPDGREIVVNGPEGSTQQDAVRFAQQHFAAQATQQPTAPPEEEGLFSGVGDFFTGTWQAGARGFGSLAEIPGAYSAALGSPESFQREKTEREARQQRLASEAPPMNLAELKRLWEEEGVLTAASRIPQFASEAIAGSLPFMAAPFSAAITAQAFVPPVGLPGLAGKAVVGAGAFIGTAALQFFGMNIGRQMEEGAETQEELDIARAALAAPTQAAAEYFIFMATGGLGKLVNRKAAEEAARTLFQSIKRGGARGAATEIPTEMYQQMAERWTAGLDLTSDDALNAWASSASSTERGSANGTANSASTLTTSPSHNSPLTPP